VATSPEVWVRFPALPDILRSGGDGTGSTQPHEYNWGATRKKKSSGSDLESREYGRRDASRWPRGTIYPQKLALSSLTRGGHSACIVPLQTQNMEFLSPSPPPSHSFISENLKLHTFWKSSIRYMITEPDTYCYCCAKFKNLPCSYYYLQKTINYEVGMASNCIMYTESFWENWPTDSDIEQGPHGQTQRQHSNLIYPVSSWKKRSLKAQLETANSVQNKSQLTNSISMSQDISTNPFWMPARGSFDVFTPIIMSAIRKKNAERAKQRRYTARYPTADSHCHVA
jgi:hypothetical protein